jgi:hypothetical protein
MPMAAGVDSTGTCATGCFEAWQRGGLSMTRRIEEILYDHSEHWLRNVRKAERVGLRGQFS